MEFIYWLLIGVLVILIIIHILMLIAMVSLVSAVRLGLFLLLIVWIKVSLVVVKGGDEQARKTLIGMTISFGIMFILAFIMPAIFILCDK